MSKYNCDPRGRNLRPSTVHNSSCAEESACPTPRATASAHNGTSSPRRAVEMPPRLGRKRKGLQGTDAPPSAQKNTLTSKVRCPARSARTERARLVSGDYTRARIDLAGNAELNSTPATLQPNHKVLGRQLEVSIDFMCLPPCGVRLRADSARAGIPCLRARGFLLTCVSHALAPVQFSRARAHE